MIRNRARAALLAAGLTALASAQFTPPAGVTLHHTYTTAVLGLGNQTGGVEFSADGLFFYIRNNDLLHRFSPTRDPGTNRISAFGAPTLVANAPGNTGSLQFGPGGTLFWTNFGANTLAQLPPGGPVVEIPLAPAGAGMATPTAIEFIPAGLPNAGDLVVSNFTDGNLRRISLTPNGNGTFTPVAGSATLFADLPPGTEAIRRIPVGPNAGRMAVCNFSVGNVLVLALDPVTGQASPSAAAPAFSTGMASSVPTEGMTFDPLTNDFFVTDFNVSLYHFTGPLQAELTAPAVYSASSGAPAVLHFNPGQAFAGAAYVVGVGLSGSSPGVVFNGVQIPLNPDAMTDFVIAAATALDPQWMGFIGTLDAAGHATATFARPGPIPPFWVGITATVCLVLPGVPHASPAGQVVVVP